MDSASHVRDQKSFSDDRLSKIWRNDKETNERTLDITSQKDSRIETSSSSRKYLKIDRMLRCEQIDAIFFMDSLFFCE